MTTNFPGPYEIRIFYSTTASVGGTIQHVQRLNCDVDGSPAPGDPFSGIDVLRRDGTPFALDSEVDDWVDLIKLLFNSGAGNTIDYAELWKFTPGTFDAAFVSTYPIAVAGTSGSGTVPAGQVIVTFRSQLGGVMKLNFMETVIAQTTPDTLPFANAGLDAIADAVVAGTVPWMARDNGYPFACIAAYPGVNEALFKRRYR